MTLSNVGSSHEASQSGHGGGRRTDSRILSLNQDGGGKTGLRDGSAAVDNRSEKIHAAERIESGPLKTEQILCSNGKFNS